MDYKYIEQLLERYWNCQTSLEEEEILRTFFNQDDIPVGLLKYQSLFLYETTSTKTDVLDEEFDERIIAQTSATLPKNGNTLPLQKRGIGKRLMPLFRAAAIVCFFITLGGIVNNSLTYREKNEKKVAVTEVKDTVKASSPSLAYDALATDSAQTVKN